MIRNDEAKRREFIQQEIKRLREELASEYSRHKYVVDSICHAIDCCEIELGEMEIDKLFNRDRR